MKITSYHIFVLLLIYLSSNLYAQSYINPKNQQKISLDQLRLKGSKSKQQEKQDKFRINDSIFKLYDVDVDLSLGEISLDMSWGDPVKNPQIRGNKASNLYGPVRRNSDGSIRWHRGFDFYAPTGTPVYAVGNGIVSMIQSHPDYGLCILITHKRPKQVYYSFYAHLSSVKVKYGDNIKKGALIGKSGTTGNAYNVTDSEEHLHFEYRTKPKHSEKGQLNPNEILKTKFYSEDPDNKWQSNVGVRKGNQNYFGDGFKLKIKR